jgi:hypothetical protein
MAAPARKPSILEKDASGRASSCLALSNVVLDPPRQRAYDGRCSGHAALRAVLISAPIACSAVRAYGEPRVRTQLHGKSPL